MRVHLDRFQRFHGGARFRALLLLGFGALGVVLSSFLLLMGGLMVLMPDGGLWENRGGFFLILFGGILPLLGAVVMIWRGSVARKRLARFRDLAAFARMRPHLDPHELAASLRLGILDTERMIVEAATFGFIEEGYPPGYVAPAMPAALVAPSQPPAASGVRLAAAASPPRSAAPGAWIGAILNGAYRIEAHLGSGGMGEVWAAQHLRTGRRYAVKTLLGDARVAPDAIKRFEREATAASALGHPGIVAVHDFHETDDGVHYLVMDLLEGETLEQRLTRVGSFAWPDAQRIAIEVGAALAVAHDAGLLHRDIKPANIFLARSPGGPERAVVLDFGLVKSIGDAQTSRITVSGAAVGTPIYMAPEQARGEPLDVRCDVYSLGAVVYEMLTGAPPFLDSTLAAVYARLLTESAPAASAMAIHPCPPAVDDLLACALAKKPHERFDSVRAFAAALSHIGAPAQRSA
jgi:serine/threonine-protein kinase